MSSGASLRRDAWLSSVLGFACGTLDAQSIEGSQEAIAARADIADLAQSSDLDLIAVKVAPASVSTLARLTNAGFTLVDTLVSFAGARVESRGAASGVAATHDARSSHGVKSTHDATSSHDAKSAIVRSAEPRDQEDVERVASRAMVLSRFSLDPQLGGTAAARVKSAWAANFFRGQRGDAMTVVEIDGRVHGFLLALHDGSAEQLVIDLIAVEPEWQGRGFGASLAMGAFRAWPKALAGMAGTQLANASSHRFYQSLGWSMVSATHVLHWHRRERAS